MMCRKRKIIGLLTAFLTVLLLGVLLLCADDQPSDSKCAEADLAFLLQTNENQEIISCWKNPEGAYFVFLPGYAETENIFLADFSGTVTIGDAIVENGMSCGIYELNKSYSLRWSKDRKNEESTLTFVRSGGVPSLYIDVESGNMDYIHMEKGNKESGTMRLYDESGKILYSGTLESVKGRGNTSWYADKKPYSLTLQQEADLLGMGSAQRWILLAEVLRNKIVYDFASDLGMPYSPECEWVDLYLNGEYAGLYLLSERNEVHPQRVDISEQGSFLVSVEYESRLQKQKYPYVLTDAGQALRIHHGESEASRIQQHWQIVENAIMSENGADPVTGNHWAEYIDLDSWVRKYLIEEVFGNGDAGALSQYYYADGRDPSSKIFAGPVWDFDYSMGEDALWLKNYTQYFTMNRANVMEDVYAPWYPELYKQEMFLNRVKELYVSEMIPGIEQLMESNLDRYAEDFLLAAYPDSIRWGLNWKAGSREIDRISSFLEKRLEFLSDVWINDTTYHTVCVDLGRKVIHGNFAVKTGECLPELPGYDDINGIGWYNAETDEPFDITQPIYEDVSIYVKKPDAVLPMIHYVPVFGMLLFLAGLIGMNCYRDKKNRSHSYDTTKAG